VPVECHQQISGLLGDPGTGGVGGDAHDVHLPSGWLAMPVWRDCGVAVWSVSVTCPR
jgi:hypothetical protein